LWLKADGAKEFQKLCPNYTTIYDNVKDIISKRSSQEVHKMKVHREGRIFLSLGIFHIETTEPA
jgi:hypothetical protein